MSTSSSSSHFNSISEGPPCKCGIPSPIRTANTEANRGRRFLGCANYKLPNNGCGFFYWIDPEKDTEKQMLEVDNKNMERKISDLRRDNQVLSKEVDELTRENEKLGKKLQEAEAKLFDYKTKCFIMLLVLCIVVWFMKNTETVPNTRNMKYLP
ncbi:uncharacterized protein LOC131325998 [Rhododendron vialii]|uniref:uncharacterized protein LOC131308612 n=1 Tax=Rhododendron vialii TaxID=182163 RepID=UPI00265E9C40|nr:uncharacterized protein LOC131308612 [Rhododendron vialii]XP_058214521.1 uncharacterized protein LOC131325998 [Rhododendron vialii]